MKTCMECGGPLAASVVLRQGTFCKSACRYQFNNRRAVRGAELYDLFMELRFNRGVARGLNVWTFMCRLAQFYNEEDREQRGRKSWNDAKTVLDRRPWLKAKIFKGVRAA